jgi:hypothetical protein
MIKDDWVAASVLLIQGSVGLVPNDQKCRRRICKFLHGGYWKQGPASLANEKKKNLVNLHNELKRSGIRINRKKYKI